MSDSTTIKSITLTTIDGGEFVVPETVAKQSKTIRQIIENISNVEYIIPLQNVPALILEKVIEYCKKHVDTVDSLKIETTDEGSSNMPASSRMSVEELRNWDKQFLDVDQVTLFDLIMAADYMDIEGLMDVACQKVADMMLGKSLEEIRQMFNIVNDLKPEEEEKIRSEFPGL